MKDEMIEFLKKAKEYRNEPEKILQQVRQLALHEADFILICCTAYILPSPTMNDP